MDLARELAVRRERGSGLLVPYLLADAGRLARTGALARAARTAGASALEVGFPFSDPIADGPLLEAASQRALRNGTRWSHLQRAVAAAARELPVAVMTYTNPVLARGLRPALAGLARAGATAVLFPDLPLEEAAAWRPAAEAAGLSLVLFAAPGASPERVRAIARRSKGFLYLVSRYGTTGAPAGRTPGLRGIVRAAHGAAPALPVLLGFGVRAAADGRAARRAGADGVVVGSAFESAIGAGGDPVRARQFLAPIARAVGGAAGRPFNSVPRSPGGRC